MTPAEQQFWLSLADMAFKALGVVGTILGAYWAFRAKTIGQGNQEKLITANAKADDAHQQNVDILSRTAEIHTATTNLPATLAQPVMNKLEAVELKIDAAKDKAVEAVAKLDQIKP